MNREQVKQQFAAWLEEGRWIAVFENQDPNDDLCGQRITTAFDEEEYDEVELGMPARESRILIGGRYRLIAKARTLEEAVQTLWPDDPDTG